LLFIGDPHLSSRPIEYRRDDYGRTILRKLAWLFQYARREALHPILLGDLFHYSRDNATWLVVEVVRLLSDRIVGAPLFAVVGNHDTKENDLADNDSLMLLVEAGYVMLLTTDRPWQGQIQGRQVVVGGTSWSERLPRSFSAPPGALVVWVTHHMVGFAGCETKRFDCHEIPGIDVVVNGHIHRTMAAITVGATTWLNPGAIARVTRSQTSRDHVPTALRIDIDAAGWHPSDVVVPCEVYEQVFHESTEAAPDESESYFIRGLRELESLRTTGGAALSDFLDANVEQFEPDVQAAVRALAREVLGERSAER
jgi:DNA repair exonuclease SbcCD nuclease subunit